MPPKIHSVPSKGTPLGQHDEGEGMVTVQLPRYVFWSLTLNVTFLIGLVAAVVIAGVMLHQQQITIENQGAAIESIEGKISGGLADTKSELIALRQVIGSQTAEDVIFLKTLILNRDVDPDLARDIAKSIHKNAQVFKRDPDFILAMIAIESNFDPNAVSHMGATGLMQVMPHWVGQLGITEDLTEVETSIRYGLQIYAFYDQMYNDTETALMAYNRGPGRVDSDLMTGLDPARNGYAKKILDVYERLQTMNIEISDKTALP